MNIELNDEKIKEIAEQEIKRYIAKKVDSVMNDGMAYWFTQQNIESITRDAVIRKIENMCFDDMVKSVRDSKTIEEIAKVLSNRFVSVLDV